jgi:hypothetical protein
VKKLKKIIGNKKGIDTILAALLMVVIVVVASVMVYAWSTGLLGTLLVTPQTGKESMISEFSGFNSNYNATLNLRNTGSVAITLSSYYVKDSAGNQWARTAWSTDTAANHPSVNGIAPNGLGVVQILIGTLGTGSGQCNAASCTSSGTAFTFANAGQYTVLIVTSRNNQFTFTVTR